MADVDTGNFLGWINASQAPWIYSDSMNKWIYCPTPADADPSNGAWCYFLK